MLKANARNVDAELRRRLPRESLGAIIGVNPSVLSASDGTPIGVISLTMSANTGLNSMMVGVLADGIEQMALLLPVDQKQNRVDH